MLKIKIPGREELTLSHLILDYNGTIAEDGEIIESIRPRLAELSKDLKIYVITIGNGFNDIQMSDAADLSICVIGKEGCCGALLMHTDVVITSIEDALDLLLKPSRLRATLRT